MAKKKNPNPNAATLLEQNALQISLGEQFNYYDRLNFIPPEQKDELWAAKALVFAKYHSSPLVETGVYEDVMQKMRGEADEAFHKKRIDPEKSEAEFFNNDFEACPIDWHVDNILEANLKQIPVNLSVKAVDEFSTSNKEENNRQIMSRSLMRNVINNINKWLNFPQLKESDDPFKYMERITAQAQQAQQTQQGQQPAAAPGNPKINFQPSKKQIPTDLIESIISQIDNSEKLGIYNTFLHKEGEEIAGELGIDYYINQKNKFVYKHATEIIQHLKGFNRCAMQMTTSAVTGTPELTTFPLDKVYASPHKEPDLSDIIHWFYEFEITYDEFVRRFGAKLSNDELRAIFDLNRRQYGGGPIEFTTANRVAINNYKIRVGYVEWVSQDVAVYSEYQTAEGNSRFKQMPTDFVPGMRKNKKGEPVPDPYSVDPKREDRFFNVWYKAYYIPYYFTSADVATLNFEEQSRYIYEFGKLQDQERYGDDEMYARSSLIGCYSPRRTWFQVKREIMKEINHLWVLIKNDVSQVMPEGLNWVYDSIVTMASSADEANASGKDAISAWAAKVKQTGSAITKLIKDKNGNPVGGAAPFTRIENGIVKGILEKMEAMGTFYDLLIKCLGQNDISEGGLAKPRTNQESIQQAIGIGGKSTFFLEEMYTDVLCNLGRKMIKYFKDIIDEGDSPRLQEFIDVVGMANAYAAMQIKNIPMRNLGIYVENVITADQKQMIMQIAQSMASAGTLDEATALFLMFIDNIKQAYAILVFKKMQMDKQLAAQKQAENEFQLQLSGQQLQNELAQIQATYVGKKELETLLIGLEGKLEAMVINLKGQWTLQGKAQINQNRIEEDMTNSQIEKLNNPDPFKNAVPERKDMPVAVS